MRFRVLLFLLCLASTTANAGINPAVVGTPAPRDAGRTQVLLYVANETAPDSREAANYQAIDALLLASDTVVGRKIAAKNAQDRDLFPAAVDAEVAALTAATAPGGPLAGHGVIVATNRLARRGKILVHRPGTSGFAERSFVPTPTDHYVLASNPLARAEVLRKILQTAADVFPPQHATFALVTKSHGNQRLAMTPNLAARHEDFAPETLTKALREYQPGRGNSVMGAGVGIAKAEYLQILADSQLAFAVVYMESCRSGLGFSDEQVLPKNVARLYTTDAKGAEYRTLDYARVFASGQLIEGLDRSLRGY